MWRNAPTTRLPDIATHPSTEDRTMKAIFTFRLITLAALIAFGAIASAPALAAPSAASETAAAA
jgi:hypothetical protein